MNAFTLINLLNVLPKDASEIIIKDRRGDELFFTSKVEIVPQVLLGVQQKFAIRRAPNPGTPSAPMYSGNRYAVKLVK